MKVHNIRMGFACNSSSTHSAIFISPGKMASNSYDCDDYYGWDDFTLVDSDDKEHYILSQILENPDLDKDPEVRDMIESIFPEGSQREPAKIDHQSVINFPKDAASDKISIEFIKAVAALVARDDVAILGGNDNSEGHPSYDVGKVVKVLEFLYDKWSDVLVRYDSENKFWAIFDPNSGMKIRFSHGLDKEIEPVRTTYPELVDLKISDYCPFGCEFCYMNSTINGKHASLESIKAIVDELSTYGVFEIALGGGEPTLHPDFEEIVRYIRSKHIVPNFTTRNYKYLKNSTAVIQHVGAVALSVSNMKEAEEALATINEVKKLRTSLGHWRRSSKLVLQTVGGVTKDLEEIMTLADNNWLSMVILGYKHTGRGQYTTVSGFDQDRYSEIPDMIREHAKHNYHYGVDTKFVQDFPEFISEFKKELFTSQEGAYSFYIDAVEGIVAPSSYSEKRVSYLNSGKTLAEHFQTVGIE